MSKRPGILVTTPSGLKGRTYEDEQLLRGKMIVHLMDDDWELKLDKAGNTKKVLCDPMTLKREGFVD